MKIKENLEEVELMGFKYTCPTCGYEIFSLSEKQIEAWAKQHSFSKHSD